MDDWSTLPPLARGDSKAADPDKHSILDLPGETRNQIFGYLIKLPDPAIICCDNSPSISFSALRLNPEIRIPVSLFASCRTLYCETVSAFYSGNTFSLGPQQHWGWDYRHFQHSPIDVPVAFLTRVGSQAHWLRNIVLDLKDITISQFYQLTRPWYGVTNRAAHCADALFEVTPLLRAIWEMAPMVGFSIQNETLRAQSTHGLVFNTSAISAIIHSILGGQLRLREHGRLLCAVSLNRDGSGGKIIWGTTNPSNTDWSFERGKIGPDYNYTTAFIAEDGGARLEMCKREKPLTLLDLPQSLLKFIFRKVICPHEGHRIDLCKDKKIDSGIIYVNWALHRLWRDTLLFNNSFELVLTTDRACTDFDRFKHLRRFLRKAFHTPGFHIPTCTVINGPGVDNRLKYILKFE